MSCVGVVMCSFYMQAYILIYVVCMTCIFMFLMLTTRDFMWSVTEFKTGSYTCSVNMPMCTLAFAEYGTLC